MKVLLIEICVVVALSCANGCASYRVRSDIALIDSRGRLAFVGPVTLTEADLPRETYEPIGTINVSVRRWFFWQWMPTREHADRLLADKARQVGADALVRVKYSQRGVDWASFLLLGRDLAGIDAAGVAAHMLRQDETIKGVAPCTKE